MNLLCFGFAKKMYFQKQKPRKNNQQWLTKLLKNYEFRVERIWNSKHLQSCLYLWILVQPFNIHSIRCRIILLKLCSNTNKYKSIFVYFTWNTRSDVYTLYIYFVDYHDRCVCPFFKYSGYLIIEFEIIFLSISSKI